LFQDRACIARFAFPEDVRVPPNEFIGDLARHFPDREAPFLARDLGMHHDLKQKVAQLLAQIGLVVPPDRVGQLIGLLEQAGTNDS
jgi:hypothetical protein